MRLLGFLVVLKGLDRIGRQSEALAAASWAERRRLVTHMPSGPTDLTAAIYRTTECRPILSPLARQPLQLE
jgi:hypothetical protein